MRNSSGSASVYSNGGYSNGGTLVLATESRGGSTGGSGRYAAYTISTLKKSPSKHSLHDSRQSLAGSIYGSTRSLRGSAIILEPISQSLEVHRNTQPLRKYHKTGTLVASGAQKPRVSADMAISNFNILFDKSIALFRPGDTIKGKVILDVWTPLDIMYIEFKIQGFATVRQFNDMGDGFTGQPVHEYYVNKRILLLSPQPGRSSLALQQGKYVSEFSYKLPHDIPPSVSQFDLGRGYVFDISYVAKANVCDVMKHPNKTTVNRVVKATKATFAVASDVDTSRSSEPIIHSEQIQLFCSPFNSDPTSVLVQLNKSLYCVGEFIRVHIELISPSKKRIKKIIAELEQTVTVNSGKKKTTRFHQTLIKAIDDGRDRKLVPKSEELPNPHSKIDLIKTGFRLPIPPNFMPSLLPGCEIITNAYCIKVVIKFRRFGGELIERIPITIAPPAESVPDKSDAKSHIPLFNKPIMQFPYFARDNTPNGRDSIRSKSSDSGDSHVSHRHHRKQTKYERVSTQYKTGLHCCGCCLLCLGYGIYN
jgi:hypothetical protein